jgi:hypothetical protein
MMGNLGHQGIQHSCPGAVLPHKRPPGGHLTAQQKQKSRELSHDRVLVENFLGEWKMLCEVIHTVFRGQITQPSAVVELAIAKTNCYICHHPLRAGTHEPPPEDYDDEDIPMSEWSSTSIDGRIEPF